MGDLYFKKNLHRRCKRKFHNKNILQKFIFPIERSNAAKI